MEESERLSSATTRSSTTANQQIQKMSLAFSASVARHVRRLDKTYKAFFGRLQRGQKQAFLDQGPHRYDSFTYPQSGFALQRYNSLKSATSDQATPRNVGEVKTLTIRREAGAGMPVSRSSLSHTPSFEYQEIGLDMGLETWPDAPMGCPSKTSLHRSTSKTPVCPTQSGTPPDRNRNGVVSNPAVAKSARSRR